MFFLFFSSFQDDLREDEFGNILYSQSRRLGLRPGRGRINEISPDVPTSEKGDIFRL